MLRRLAQLTVRRHRLVLLLALVLFATPGAGGGGGAKHLSTGGFDDPSAPSSRAKAILSTTFGQGDPNLVLLVTARNGTVDTPAVAAEATALTQELSRQPGVAVATSYWSLGSPAPLRSKDARQAPVLARPSGRHPRVRDVAKGLSP